MRFERTFTVDIDEATAKQYILAYMRKLDYTYVPGDNPVLVFTRGTVKHSLWQAYPKKWESMANIMLENKDGSVNVRAVFEPNTILDIGLHKNKLLRMWHRANWRVWDAELDDLEKSLKGDEYTTDSVKRANRKAFLVNNIFLLTQAIIYWGAVYGVTRVINTFVFKLFGTSDWGSFVFMCVILFFMYLFWIRYRRLRRVTEERSRISRGNKV